MHCHWQFFVQLFITTKYFIQFFNLCLWLFFIFYFLFFIFHFSFFIFHFSFFIFHFSFFIFYFYFSYSALDSVSILISNEYCVLLVYLIRITNKISDFQNSEFLYSSTYQKFTTNYFSLFCSSLWFTTHSNTFCRTVYSQTNPKNILVHQCFYFSLYCN